MSEMQLASIAGAERSQYVTFTLGEGEYGVEILSVQEFKGYTSVTPIPNMPPYLRGVMNLRGVIIPVYDLRLRFGIPALLNEFSVIVVAVIGERTVGLVVDTVSDVVDIRASDIQRSDELNARADAPFLRGIARVAERLVVLLDLQQILALEQAPAAAAS